MMGQAKDRKWGSSGSAQPRNRIPSALKRPSEVDQVRWARPPSAARPPSTRPDSKRLLARPGSRLESRPDSRLESRPESRIDLLRPKSGVRPLSGKVFMRRTADHGWVAKAYNVGEPMGTHSQPDLNLFDDLSDCESLDSFFDEEFDEQSSEEKLGNLLSCNTLGVDSKGRKPDWVAGKLGIPEFHCPRCRDHWYGLTNVPCDEELARLIREGLWKTGKEGGGKLQRGGRGEGDHKRIDKDRDYRSHSSITLSAKSSTTRLNRETENGEGKGHRGSSMVGNEKDPAKRKRRITFKLDNDTEGSGGSAGNSRTQLDNYGGYQRAHGSKSFGDGLSNGGGRQLEGSHSVGGGDDHMKRARSDGSESRDAGEGGGAGGVGGAGNRRRGKGNDLEDNVTHSNSSGPLDSSTRGTKRESEGTKGGAGSLGLLNSDDRLNDSTETGGRNGQDRLSHGSQGTDSATGARSGGLGDGAASSLSCDLIKNSHNSLSSGASNTPGSTSGHAEGEGGLNDSRQRAGGKDSSSLGSSSQVRGTGSRRGSLSTEDHGKNVRKPGGYMRAVDPNSSEWGDPTHARPFISSTATSRTISRCGSLVMGRDSDDEDKSGRVSLPPIVPAISSKKPLLDLSDIMGGFQFTRAWTFSYHK